jgi:cobalt-zinc-cadmium efflux system protein
MAPAMRTAVRDRSSTHPRPPPDHDYHGEHEHGGHAGHLHRVSVDADGGKLAIALALILAFMAVEALVGILASSLALLSDAAHMLTDAAAIALSLVVVMLAQQPAKGTMTYGLKRTEILSAQSTARRFSCSPCSLSTRASGG